MILVLLKAVRRLLRLCLSALGGVRVWQRRSWLEQWEPRAKSRRSPKTSPRGCWYLQKTTLDVSLWSGRDGAMLLLCSKRFTRHSA